MEYYITDGQANYGPFSLDQLREKNITPVTKIWYAGLSGWTAASEIPELSGLFSGGSASTAPPPPQYHSNSNFNPGFTRPPKTWLVESILVTLFCCLPFGIAGIINASRVESKFYAGDTEGALHSSKEAGKWTKIGFWIGLIGFLLYMIYFIIILLWAAKNGNDIEGISPTF